MDMANLCENKGRYGNWRFHYIYFKIFSAFRNDGYDRSRLSETLGTVVVKRSSAFSQHY